MKASANVNVSDFAGDGRGPYAAHAGHDGRDRGWTRVPCSWIAPAADLGRLVEPVFHGYLREANCTAFCSRRLLGCHAGSGVRRRVAAVLDRGHRLSHPDVPVAKVFCCMHAVYRGQQERERLACPEEKGAYRDGAESRSPFSLTRDLRSSCAWCASERF